MRAKRILISVLTAAAAAQQPGPVFRTSTNLVVVDVFARDRSGKDIPELRKEDFVVLEDGKPQAVSVFEYQRLSGSPLPPAPPQLAARPAKAPPQRSAPQAIASAGAGKLQYPGRRLIAMFFDLSSMPPADQVRAQKAALKFLSAQMTSADLVSVMTFSTQLQVLQDFTDDRDRLIQALRGLQIGEGSELAGEADTADENAGEDTGAAFTADESEFNIFNTDRKLSALESAAQMLAGLPEKKALVYFSSGVGKTGVENQSQLRSTVNAAVRANISFYPIDARGLTALPPGGEASKAAPRGTGIFTGYAANQQRSRFNDQQETLVSLAADTGGKAFLDSNDLALGVTQAQEDIRSYYILGYYSANPAQDGRYRRIQVRIAGQPEARLDYRSGYFAPKQFGNFSAADKENQLAQALLLGDPVTDLPLALETNYFWLGRDRYFVPIGVKIPGSEILLAKKGSNEVTEFDFIGQVRDGRGRLVASVRDGIKVRIEEPNTARAPHRNYEYDTGFVLTPGEYQLKFLARENQTGRMGTFETRFRVPDLSAESDYLRVSSVVWANQREKVDAAVGSALKKRQLSANPLVEGGEKLIPSITRVFRKNQNLYVYLEAYNAARNPADKQAGVTAAVSFYRGHVKAFETAPLRIADGWTRIGTLPIRFQVPLAKLAPGRYTCQVTVVDEIGKKFAFPRATVMVLP